jgi:putative inorganic carbon (HCO3(-)) transporter
LGVALLGEKKKRIKIMIFVGLGLIIFSLYFTFSYAAWIAVLVGVFFLAVFAYKKEKRKLVFSVFFLALIALGLFFFQTGGEKLDNLISFERSSLQSRLMVWDSAVKIIKNNLIFGIGPGLFQNYYLEYQKYFNIPYLEWAVPQPHNLFLAWWLQAGIFGLFGFIWLIFLFFNNLWQFFKKTKQPLIIISLMAVMIYILVHGLVDTTFWKNDLALLFWLTTALGYKATRLSD